MKKETRILIIYRCFNEHYVLVVYRGESIEEIAYTVYSDLLKTILSMRTYGEVRKAAALDTPALVAAGKAGIHALPSSTVIDIVARKRRSLEALCCIYYATIKNKTGDTINICYPGASAIPVYI